MIKTLCLVMLLSSCVFAQVTGSAVPDNTAQRLFLVQLTNLPSDLQQAYLTNNVGLTPPDVSAALGIINTFKTSYLNAVTQYNNAVDEGSYTSSVASTFQDQQASTVATAIVDFQANLSADGYNKISTSITAIKTDIRMSNGPVASKTHHEPHLVKARMNMQGAGMGCCYNTVETTVLQVISWSPLHAKVTITYTLEGSVSGSYPPTVVHQGTIITRVGNQVNSQNSGWHSPNYYINLPAAVILDTGIDTCLIDNPPGPCADNTTASVTCSVAGT